MNDVNKNRLPFAFLSGTMVAVILGFILLLTGCEKEYMLPEEDKFSGKQAQFSENVNSKGGPVILAGVDPEFGGSGHSHGHLSDWAIMVENGILKHVTNSGSGLIVIGKAPQGSPVEAFRSELGSLTGESVTYAQTPAEILSVDFSKYRMIGVVSSYCELPPVNDPNKNYGLCNDGNQALIQRAGDVAAFVNNGGGLLGFTQATRDPNQCQFDDPWGYIGDIGDFTIEVGLCYSTISHTDDGQNVFLTHPEFSFSCWHDAFTEGPEFLKVLAWKAGYEGSSGTTTADQIPYGAKAAALGGIQVVLANPNAEKKEEEEKEKEKEKPKHSAECVDLIAAQHEVSGEVCVIAENDTLFVTYTTFNSWMIGKTHLTVSTDLPGGGEWTDRKNRWQNGSGNPAPGRFPYSTNHNHQTDFTFTYSIPLSDISGNPGSTSAIHLGAHAEVHENQRKETAWGNGKQFVQRGNWGMHFSYNMP